MSTESGNSDKPYAQHEPHALPPEVATLLIAIGIAGIPLPGPGIPFILAGGLVLWPRTFGPLDDRFRKSYPKSHGQVARILKRFDDDLSRRYPSG
ncbi:hypothetical protein GC170_07030 [bacterium]|nr:hypothetical protein [bacterium]